MVKGSEVPRMTNPRPGELWLIKSDDGRKQAVVCVMSVGRRVVSAAFTDSDPDLAYDEEVVFEAGQAAPWVVRLSPTLVGPVPRGRSSSGWGRSGVPWRSRLHVARGVAAIAAGPSRVSARRSVGPALEGG